MNSEPALRDDEYIAGLHLDVCRHIAVLDQVLEAHAVLRVVFGGTQDGGPVAIGEVGDATDRDHHVEDCHFLLVGENLRFGCLSDDADLLAVRSDEAGDDDGDDRITDELGQLLLDVAGQGGESFTLAFRAVVNRGGVFSSRRTGTALERPGFAPATILSGSPRPNLLL